VTASAEPAPGPARDPYVDYLRAFFARWSPLYDLFAWPIGFVYAAAAKAAGARSGRTVLDLCTGTGELALRCARRGAAVTAVDFTASMLDRARRKARGLPIRLVEMDARRLAFADRAFDVAVLSFALHDMPRSVRALTLREAARVSRQGVVVLDYEPPRGGPLRAAVVAGLGTYETAYLKPFLAEGGAAAAIAAAGLDVARTSRPLPGLFAIRVARAAGAPPTAPGSRGPLK
jgi:demethylmenaquinone methyltransferase/2-methoxy-6-polyprenyl-1,4-benzoquinol methylase